MYKFVARKLWVAFLILLLLPFLSVSMIIAEAFSMLYIVNVIPYNLLIIHSASKLSKRVLTLAPSPTLALNAKVKALQQNGVQIINLTAGEPDFQTPLHIKNAGKKAIDDGFTYYTQSQGIAALREAIAKKIHQDMRVTYDASEIMIGAGSKQLLYSLFQVLCNKGDEVIVPVPTWTTYVEQIKLAQAKPVLLPLTSPFKLTAKDIAKVLTSKTKILLLNSPANPTGAMIDTNELRKIGELAVKNKFWIISDEIYEKIIYGMPHISIASLDDRFKKQTIMVNGISKAYAMTGWRLGYAAGPKDIITIMADHASQIISNASSISQAAAVEAYLGDQKPLHTMVKIYEKRRQKGLEAFAKIKEIDVIPPDGAFYFFVDIRKLLGGKYATATDWCEALLVAKHVAVVPGEAFLYPGYFRMSFAASEHDIINAIKKIKEFITE